MGGRLLRNRELEWRQAVVHRHYAEPAEQPESDIVIQRPVTQPGIDHHYADDQEKQSNHKYHTPGRRHLSGLPKPG